LSKSIKEAEKIARSLMLELQALPEDQVFGHFRKRLVKIPKEYQPLVDNLVGATLIYGHKTSGKGMNSNSASEEPGQRWISSFMRKRYVAPLAIVAIVAIVGLVGAKADMLSSNQANEPGNSELRKVRAEDLHNLIVFVHGIRDDGNLTWTNSETNTSWLELIKEDNRFNDFDLASYHYSSMLFQNGNLSISNVADQLAFRLDGELIDGYDRIVFVAHSMGGIAVRNMLLKHDIISKKVPLVYFLATPTAGADIAKLADILGIDNRQLRALTSFGKSNFLQDQSSSWRASKLSLDVYSLCAFENVPTLGIMVVDQASAESLCTGPTIPSGQTHSDIAKPYSRDSIIYKVFADEVAALASINRGD